jgi:hypothetical protein
MSTFCPVCPVQLYESMKRWNQAYLRNNLFLAHDVVEHSSRYQVLFEGFRHFSFMDNSLVELGGAVDLQMVKEATSIVRAKVYVLPDVMGDGPSSTERTISAYDEWKQAIPDAEPMAVVQGGNLQEWTSSLETLVDRLPRIGWFAIPRFLTAPHVYGSRVIPAELVHAYAPNAKIHLLGFSDNMYDDVIAARHPAVSSIDSAVPIRMGSRNQAFSLNTDPGKREDWWEKGTYSPLVGTNLMLVQRLVRTSQQLRQADISL